MNTSLPLLQYKAEPLLPYVLSSSNGKLAAGIVVAIAILCPLLVTTYHLFLSPLAGFPGPRIAAATGYYEFYYDLFKKGSYVFEIEKMHDKYGQSTPPHDRLEI
jgi:hypothetical protein